MTDSKRKAGGGFNLEKMMEAIELIKNLPPVPTVRCHPQSRFAFMGIDFRVDEYMPINMALVMQEGKILQMWKIENGEVKAYEFKEPLSIFAPGIEPVWKD